MKFWKLFDFWWWPLFCVTCITNTACKRHTRCCYATVAGFL